VPKKSKMVHVSLGEDGRATHIFKGKNWLNCNGEMLLIDRGKAVGQIRQQVFERCSVEGSSDWHECERCGRTITWETMEMHETLPKGSGGEVSLENCEALCHQCHQGAEDSAHGNRRWHSAKISSEEGLE
jgi:5-methylcytosine-specific restriction endonuclease McrA